MANHSPYKPYSVTSVSYKAYTPEPPKRTRVMNRRRKIRKRINTEFHDALFSLGCNDRTGKLSDREFALQFFKEVGYLSDLSFSYFGRAARNFGELIRLIFGN